MIAKIKIKKKQNGQAAITDALYFLVIIVALCVLLFKYSATYGTRIQEGLGNLYFKEYVNSTMKTIFYTSIPLNFDLNLDQDIEIDYLIVAIKQDFFADGQIGYDSDISKMDLIAKNSEDIAKFNLYSTIKAIMKPLDSYDYVFYFFNEDSDSQLFNYFMLKTTAFEENTTNTNGDYKYQKFYNIVGNNYYLCNPIIPKDVIKIISKGNKIYSSSVPLYFKKKGGESNKINATFAIWPGTIDINSTDLETLKCNLIEKEIYN